MAKPIHCMIRVLKEDRSVAFYRVAFGMEVADRFAFDGFTLVEPGLVPPAQWRPELGNPLVTPRDDDGDAPVLRLVAPERPADDPGAAWHLCGIGVKP